MIGAGSEVPTAPTVKVYRHGTDRIIPPGETVEWVRPFLRDMGITRVANVTGLDVIGLPVVMVCPPNSRSLAVSQGKGMTLEAAKASGLMESIESYHAEHVTQPLILGSFAEMVRRRALVDAFGLVAGASGPFLADRRQLWMEGADLIGGEAKWVPLDAVHTDFTFDAQLGQRMLDPTSNGLASGNHRLEAISHALCELIERDAIALLALQPAGRREAARLDLETVDDAGCREILDRLAAAGLAVAVWDATSDIGLAAFSCMIAENPETAISPLCAASGHGCHPRREVALSRALSEAVQSRLTGIARLAR